MLENKGQGNSQRLTYSGKKKDARCRTARCDVDVCIALMGGHLHKCVFSHPHLTVSATSYAAYGWNHTADEDMGIPGNYASKKNNCPPGF